MRASYFSPHQVWLTRLSPEMEQLANTLRALANTKEVNLLAVANALEKHANEGE